MLCVTCNGHPLFCNSVFDCFINSSEFVISRFKKSVFSSSTSLHPQKKIHEFKKMWIPLQIDNPIVNLYFSKWDPLAIWAEVVWDQCQTEPEHAIWCLHEDVSRCTFIIALSRETIKKYLNLEPGKSYRSKPPAIFECWQLSKCWIKLAFNQFLVDFMLERKSKVWDRF